ncbi:MAG: hypothetical protein HY070_04055 [Chloroflexi bacterium]|nr:hypothetical protein [Chloroflexota bacterium]
MNPLDLVPYFKEHRVFAILSSIGLAGLYAEEGWATFVFWSRRSANEATLWIGMIALIVFCGYLLSFFYPPSRLNAAWKYPRAWGIFSRITALSLAIALATNVIAMMLLFFLADGNLIGAYHLLRDGYVYTLAGLIIFHGLLLYVRYLRYIYHSFGAPFPGKVIGASAGIAILILLIVGFIFAIDLRQLELAPLAEQGILGLHTYGRGLYLLTLLLGAYAWHFRWIADH